jgi:hypothetical protein
MRMIAHLVLKTSDAEFQTLKVPVLIEGNGWPVTPASAETADADETQRP